MKKIQSSISFKVIVQSSRSSRSPKNYRQARHDVIIFTSTCNLHRKQQQQWAPFLTNVIHLFIKIRHCTSQYSSISPKIPVSPPNIDISSISRATAFLVDRTSASVGIGGSMREEACVKQFGGRWTSDTSSALSSFR
eukprot:scaffold1460_cov256-Chaetoceros_neogracile.AAC.23